MIIFPLNKGIQINEMPDTILNQRPIITYKFRCEIQYDYDCLQKVCGKDMSNVLIIPQFIDGYPIPDRVVEFQSTLSIDDLLRKFKSVIDAHVAFQTLMPIENYTGERDYNRQINKRK